MIFVSKYDILKKSNKRKEVNFVNLQQLNSLIHDHHTIAIFAHTCPDADAVCSALALKEFISTNYLTMGKKSARWYKKKVDIFIDCEDLPENLKVLANKYKASINPTPKKKYPLAIALDCANLERLGKYAELFEHCDETVNIDHHKSNPKFAKFNFIFDTSSTCENLYIFFKSFEKTYGAKINTYMLTQLYSGILTDTNNLENNADKLVTRNNVGAIVEALGSKKASIIKSHFFKNLPKSKLALTTISYNPKNRKYYEDGKICIITLNNKAFAKSHASLEDAEGIVDSALNTEGVFVSALILEPERGNYKVKLRGKGINVSQVAEKFSGGGHEFMSAFDYKGNYNVLNMSLLRECKKTLEQNIDNVATIEDVLEDV